MKRLERDEMTKEETDTKVLGVEPIRESGWYHAATIERAQEICSEVEGSTYVPCAGGFRVDNVEAYVEAQRRKQSAR